MSDQSLDRRPLQLYEEALLLAIGDRTGNVVINQSQASILISSAIFAELSIDESISLDGTENVVRLSDEYAESATDDKNKDRVHIDPLIADVIQKLSSAKTSHSLKDWIGRVSGQAELLPKAAQQLCDRGILEAKVEKVLWFFSRDYYPEINPEPEKQVRDKVRSAVMGGASVEPKVATLVGLASQMNLLSQMLSPSELKEQSKRIEMISRGDACSNVSQQIFAYQQAALLSMTLMMAMD